MNKDTKDNFSYRFEMDGKEVIFKIDSGIKEIGKNPAYPIQNQLKEGYAYKIQFTDKMITSVEEKKNQRTYRYQPPISGVPGKRTLKNFLQTAFMPIGTTLYIYGGYNEYYYAGLDCSGYVGWIIYNVMNTESGLDGYITSAVKIFSRMVCTISCCTKKV